jgi:hypothetical protein
MAVGLKFRVEFWFLDTNRGGWCQVGWAYVEAADRDHALGKCVQRAVRLGFVFNTDTLVSVKEEDGSSLRSDD